MSSNVDGADIFDVADDGDGISPDRSSTNCLTVNGGFVEGEIAVSLPQPSTSTFPGRNACCQALQANMFRAIASTAEMAKRVADYDRIKQENLQMSVQLAELHNYTEELQKKRDELQAQLDRAIVQASTAQKHEDEMFKQLTAMEHNSANLRKKADELEDLQRKYTHLTIVLQDTQEKRAKSARDSKQLCNVVNNLKKDIEKHKEKEDKLKFDKSAAMDRLKAYKKYVPMMIRTIDTLVSGDPDVHTRRRIDILAQPDVRLRLLGSSEVAKEDEEPLKSDDDWAENLENLIRSGVKAPVPAKPTPKKKLQKSPVKSPGKPGSDLEDDDEEDLEMPHSSSQQPQFVTPPRRGTRTTPSTYRRGGRAAAASARRGVRALADPEATDREIMNRLANKLSREAREHSPEPTTSTAPAVVSSIHGKKGLTVREQQASQLKKMTVKERVALMKKKEAEKTDVPSHQDMVLPTPSKESMMDDLRLSPTPTKEKPGADSPDVNGDLLSDLRLSPSPAKSVIVSEKSVEPPRPHVTFSLDDVSDLFDTMDYEPNMYSPTFPAETTVSEFEKTQEINPLAPEEAPSNVPAAPKEDEEKKEQKKEKEVVVEEKGTTSLLVDRPHSIVPSASLPHLEAEWPSASTVRALEVMEKVATELEPFLAPLKMKKPISVASTESDVSAKNQQVVAMDTSELPPETTTGKGETAAVSETVMPSVPVVTGSAAKRQYRVTITKGVKPNLPKPTTVAAEKSSDSRDQSNVAKEKTVVTPSIEDMPSSPDVSEKSLADETAKVVASKTTATDTEAPGVVVPIAQKSTTSETLPPTVADEESANVDENAEKPTPVFEEQREVEDALYESDSDLVIDCPDYNVLTDTPVPSKEAKTFSETRSPVKEEEKPSSDKEALVVDEEEEGSMRRTRSRTARIRTISTDSETRRTSPRKRIVVPSTPRMSKSPSLKIDESDKESVISNEAQKAEHVPDESKANQAATKTPAPRKSKRLPLPSVSEDNETPIKKAQFSATPSTPSFKEPGTSRTRVSRVRQETRPRMTIGKSDGKPTAETPVSATSSSRPAVKTSSSGTTVADDDLTETPAPSRRIAHRPAQKQDGEAEKDKKPTPVTQKPIISPPSAVLDYITKHNIEPESVNTIVITGDDFMDEEEEEDAVAASFVAKGPPAKEDSKQEKPTLKKPSTLGSLRTAVARGAPASAQMNKLSSALGKRLRQATTKCLPPAKATPKTRQPIPPSASKPSGTPTPTTKPSEVLVSPQSTSVIREPKAAPSRAIPLEVALPTKMKDRAPKAPLVKRKAEALVSAVEPKRICREKRIESIIVSKKSPESLLERALDFDCDPDFVKRKMLEEDLAAIKTLSAKAFAKIMAQVAIRRNTGDQWFTFQAQLRKGYGERIVNKSEDRLIKVPHELCADELNIFDPFIRLLFTYLASKRTIEANVCYKMVRLIAFAVFAEERISTPENIDSFTFASDPAKIFRSVLTTIAHEHPECLGKSVVYMINTAPYFKYLSFLNDADSIPLRRLISLYSNREEKEAIQFVWRSRLGRGNVDLPPISQFRQWYMALSPPEGTFSVHGNQAVVSEEWISLLKTKELYFTSSLGVPILLGEVEELDLFLSEKVLRSYSLGLEMYPGKKFPTNAAVLSMDVVQELALRLKSMSMMVSPLLLRDQQTVSSAQVRKFIEGLRCCLTKIVQTRKHLREKPSPNASQQCILLSLLTDFINDCAPVFVLRS